MSPLLTLIALAFGLSVDAFAAALGKGAGEARMRLGGALRIAVVFGGMEAVMPMVGFLIGLALAQWVSEIDHWVAFTLLLAVGLHMIWQAFQPDDGTPDEADRPVRGPRWVHLILAAVATSIDATVVGVSLAMMDLNILIACLTIFIVTTTLCTLGVLIGRRAAGWLGHWAEAAGGLVLVAIGGLILFEHLSNGI